METTLTARTPGLSRQSITKPDAIREAADAFRTDNPKARARNVADGIGISEAELVASRIGQPDEEVFRLNKDFRAFLTELEALGPLMALTRNDHCVHEKTGVYDEPDMNLPHRMGLFLNDPIDLRIFFRTWKHGFFVTDPGTGRRPDRLSFQFFDEGGTAVHKVYATKETDRDAFRKLAERFKADGQRDETSVVEIDQPVENELTDEAKEAFIAGWRALQDTHDFFPLLKEHGVSRRQAVRLAPEDLARRVSTDTHRAVLESVAESGLEIMVFVGNRGCVQIHTGPVKRLVETDPWYNVLDPGFNLHLRESAITEAYVVTKPTEDGLVTALELFDKEGTLVVQFFGKRKPGIPEQEAWRELVLSV